MLELKQAAMAYANALIEYHKAQASSMVDWKDATYIALLDTQNALNLIAKAVAQGNPVA